MAHRFSQRDDRRTSNEEKALDAREYDYTVSGPFVPAEQLTGAIEQLTRAMKALMGAIQQRNQIERLYDAALNWFPDEQWRKFEESEAFADAEREPGAGHV